MKEQIVALDMKSLSNLSRLIKVVDDVASQIPEDDQMPTMGRDKGQILSEVSILWAGIGDIAHAQKSAKLIKNTKCGKTLHMGLYFEPSLGRRCCRCTEDRQSFSGQGSGEANCRKKLPNMWQRLSL
ncbi:MAG: hypothetical protein IPO53_10625 [Chitinophagaceae bacterium]|nr:hypothetical protein [Chitinophagaceae bacterium]